MAVVWLSYLLKERMKEKGENTKMDTYSGCLPRPNLDKIPQLCLLRKLTLHFSSMCVPHEQSNKQMIFIGEKNGCLLCVLFCGKQQHEFPPAKDCAFQEESWVVAWVSTRWTSEPICQKTWNPEFSVACVLKEPVRNSAKPIGCVGRKSNNYCRKSKSL